MELSLDEATEKKYKIVSKADFASTYAEGVKPQALDYCMEEDKIDFVRVGKIRMIVLTDKSLAYKPNKSTKRTTMET